MTIKFQNFRYTRKQANSRLNNMNLPKIKSLTNFDNHSNALELLYNIYHEIQEIIDQKGYNISNLKEFYPNDDCLLGENQSNDTDSVIYLRLRTPEDPKVFLSFEEILETFLHEICHCEVGPHNDAFHNLLDHLTEWYEQTIMTPVISGLNLREIAASKQAERLTAFGTAFGTNSAL